MSAHVSDRVESGQPRAGCFFLAVPVVSIAIVFFLYGYMLFYGFKGRTATGDEVRLVIDTCPRAQEFILDRVAAMGLPYENVVQGPTRLSLEVVLPGDADVAKSIPATLVSAANFEVFERDAGPDDAPLFTPDDYSYAGVRLTLTASPATFVVLQPEAAKNLRAYMENNPYNGLRYVLDGEVVGGTENVPSIGDGQIEVIPSGVDNDKQVMEVAAARGIAINSGPLPCAATLVSQDTLRRAPKAD